MVDPSDLVLVSDSSVNVRAIIHRPSFCGCESENFTTASCLKDYVDICIVIDAIYDLLK